MKIHHRYCQGLRASSDSQRRTVAVEMDAQIPSATACRASSGQLHRDIGNPASAGGVQAAALTVATCTALADRLPEVPWTFTRAVDSSLDPRRSWRRLLSLPRLVHVRSAGSPRGMEVGYEWVAVGYFGAVLAEQMNDIQCRRFAHVVDLAFVGHS